MNPKVMIPILGVGSLGAALTMAADSRAGYTVAPFAVCSGTACYGTMAGFRNNADPQAYAEFGSDTGAGWFFQAQLNGTNYSCSAPTSNAALMSQTSQALGVQGYFYVTWNSSGQCTWLLLETASSYDTAW